SYKEGLPEAYALPVAYSPFDILRQSKELSQDAIIARVELENNQIGTLYDGVYDESFRSKLLQLLMKKRNAKGVDCEISGRILTHHPGERIASDDLLSRVLKVDASNTSIIFGDKLFLKLMRRVEEGKNPEIEIGSILAKHSFESSPKLLGYAEYKMSESEPAGIIVLLEYLRNQGDAWSLFSEEFSRFVERALSNADFWNKYAETKPLTDRSPFPQAMIELLGLPFVENVILLAKRTAEFHLALISETEDPDFVPEPFGYLYQVSIAQSMVSYATRVFGQMASISNVGDEVKKGISTILEMQSRLLGKFNSLRSASIDCVRSRIHGDFHLGQVLYSGNDFAIIDYEGEPLRSIGERRTKRSPIRDVAGMMRSFQYAAYSYVMKSVTLQKDREKGKLEKLVEVWSNFVSRIYLSSYIEKVKGSKIIPSEIGNLAVMLDAYLLEKAIYEVGYELNNRPDWAMIPIRGVLDMMNIESEKQTTQTT
ncbi:MAG: putative maltokinase, partial [Nitrososphaerota archaeon]|nr:putative maltokinase [Nitrososphaerota archaeon]